MIVKLRTNNISRYEWTVIDKVDTVNWKFIDTETRQNKNFEPDYYIQEQNNNGTINEKNTRFAFMTLIMQNGEIKTISSNETIFLLNDEGKTIDKIN